MALVDCFLGRGGIYRNDDPSRQVTRESSLTVFPFTWGAGLLDILYALATMGHGGLSVTRVLAGMATQVKRRMTDASMASPGDPGRRAGMQVLARSGRTTPGSNGRSRRRTRKLYKPELDNALAGPTVPSFTAFQTGRCPSRTGANSSLSTVQPSSRRTPAGAR